LCACLEGGMALPSRLAVAGICRRREALGG
jgi:hypothetical protein